MNKLNQKQETSQQVVFRISSVSIAVNLGLSFVKLFAGIIGARMGYPICDAIASVIICGFIVNPISNVE